MSHYLRAVFFCGLSYDIGSLICSHKNHIQSKKSLWEHALSFDDFQGQICSKRFFAHYTLLCPCVLVFDMSTVGAWCQNFLTNIASFLFDYLRLHLIFSLVCNIDGRPPRCQMCCRSRSWRSVDGNMFLQLLRRFIEGAFWTIGSHFDVASTTAKI